MANGFVKKVRTPEFQKNLNLYLFWFWIVLVIPTLIWWSQSILWLALMSIYAIITAHLAAYEGARGELLAKRQVEGELNDLGPDEEVEDRLE